MEVIFEVSKYDIQTINQIKSTVSNINDTYDTNGLNGTEIVAIVVALTPAIKELIINLWSKKSVSIKISNEYGTAEIVANSMKELEKSVDAYLKMVDKARSAEEKTDGDRQVDSKK